MKKYSVIVEVKKYERYEVKAADEEEAKRIAQDGYGFVESQDDMSGDIISIEEME